MANLKNLESPVMLNLSVGNGIGNHVLILLLASFLKNLLGKFGKNTNQLTPLNPLLEPGFVVEIMDMTLMTKALHKKVV